jgi:hypothetical protein
MELSGWMRGDDLPRFCSRTSGSPTIKREYRASAKRLPIGHQSLLCLPSWGYWNYIPKFDKLQERRCGMNDFSKKGDRRMDDRIEKTIELLLERMENQASEAKVDELWTLAQIIQILRFSLKEQGQ